MNKTLIIVLAVCLVSVHAFVKRDAPAAADASKDINFDPIQKELEALAKSAQEVLKSTFSSENVQKKFTEGQETINKVIEEMKKAIDASTTKKE